MSAEAHDIKHEVRKYNAVFTALLVLSCITVAVSRIPNMTTSRAITLGLAIATVKASLVAGVFMHLLSEKRFIYSVLALTVLFFFAVLLVPLVTGSDPLHGTKPIHHVSAMAGESSHGGEDTHTGEDGHSAPVEEHQGGH